MRSGQIWEDGRVWARVCTCAHTFRFVHRRVQRAHARVCLKQWSSVEIIGSSQISPLTFFFFHSITSLFVSPFPCCFCQNRIEMFFIRASLSTDILCVSCFALSRQNHCTYLRGRRSRFAQPATHIQTPCLNLLSYVVIVWKLKYVNSACERHEYTYNMNKVIKYGADGHNHNYFSRIVSMETTSGHIF